MAREFKPVRFFVMIALAAFVVCGVTAFYTHRAAHGRTADERAAYAIGLKVGEQAPSGATLPTDADLNMMAQKYFKQQGSGNQLRSPSRAAQLRAWDFAFETGYTDGFNKTHPWQ
jgi:hypothetical protein